MTREKVTEWADSALRIMQAVGAVAAILSAAGFVWLRSEFIPRSEFEQYKNRTESAQFEQTRQIAAIQQTLAVIAEKMLADQRQDKKLDEFDSRLRDLERLSSRR